MPSKFAHALFTSLLLRLCLSHGTGLRFPENTATASRRQPVRFIKSSLDTSSFGTGSRASVGVNFYRLPPSPANLLKPDGFQFYTYNERGDMITRQMTMQEIQALIASGGPNHSNIAIQEPQKVEDDTLTGGKKVIDVVEKVQSVLKSAMDKPLSTLTGPHPTIPEKANVEWSNILPAILAGDKYGNKVEEHQHAEESTTKWIATSSNSETTITQSEKNGSHAVTSDIATKSPSVEKIMIPVRVITTERVGQHTITTTRSYDVRRTTEATPSASDIPYEHRDHSAEKGSTATNTHDTKSTTVGSGSSSHHLLSPSEATKNNFDNASSPNVSAGVVDTKEIRRNETKSTVADTSIGKIDFPSNVRTPPSSVSNRVHASAAASKEPFSTWPSSRYDTTSAPNHSTASMRDSSTTIDHDTATKASNLVATTERSKPLSADPMNSLSSTISQLVSDDDSSVSSDPSEFESAPNGNDTEAAAAHDSGTEGTVVSESRTTTRLPEISHKDEGTTVEGNDAVGENVRDSSFSETTSILALSSESLESIALSSAPIVEKGPTNYSKGSTESVTTIDQTAVSVAHQSSLSSSSNGNANGTTAATTTATPPNPSDSSEICNSTIDDFDPPKPVAIIDDILRTVSTETVTPASTESVIVVPNALPSGLLANTFASSLIAGFGSQNSVETQTVTENAAVSFSESRPSTSTATLNNSEPSATSVTNDTTTARTKEEAAPPPVRYSQSPNSRDDATTPSEATDRAVFPTATTSTDSLPPRGNHLSTVTAESSSSSSLSRYTTLNPVHASSISGNDAVSSNQGTTGVIGGGSSRPSSDSQATDEESDKTDNTTATRLNEDTTTERSDHESSVNESKRINASTNSIEWAGEAQRPQYHTVVEPSIHSAITTSATADAQEFANATKTTAGTHSDGGAVPPTTNDVPMVSSSENRIGDDRSNETASTKKSNADGNVTTTITGTDSTNSNGSENETETLVESYESDDTAATAAAGTNNRTVVGSQSSESQAKEKSEEERKEEFASRKKANDTNPTSSHHVWQRISLHQTTPTPPTNFGTTTRESDTPVSTATATTMLETDTMKTEAIHSESAPQTEDNGESAVSLDASKGGSGGLDISSGKAGNDVANFSRLCNELAIKFWIAANKGLSTGRSLALSPFGMISLLAMIFLGARGSTSDQMNEVLGLDNVATFNPHLIFQNVTDTVSLARNQGIANAAFVRELFADKVKVRKLLPFYKEQAQQFYEGLVAEVNFATISDLARRRTNLLVRKQTGGRIKDFVKSNAVPLRSPLAAISANVFQTDCNTSSASTTGRDGELYFAVSSAHRLRKLIPVPATVWRSNSLLAGYEPGLDATAIAIGGVDKLVSTIFLLPGQQGRVAPGDTLDRLEQRFVKGAFRDGGWHKLLKVLIPRPGLELQLPKFSHRSVVNATAALKRMGLDQLFSNHADLKGINGIGNRLFLSDVLQMNLFSTCGDENTANGRHHVEAYPAASPSSSRDSRRYRSSSRSEGGVDEDSLSPSSSSSSSPPPPQPPPRRIDVHRKSHSRGVSTKEEGSTTTAIIANRAGDKQPRLKLDQPFLYFVRHNPTGLILHMGRFNPRLS